MRQAAELSVDERNQRVERGSIVSVHPTQQSGDIRLGSSPHRIPSLTWPFLAAISLQEMRGGALGRRRALQEQADNTARPAEAERPGVPCGPCCLKLPKRSECTGMDALGRSRYRHAVRRAIVHTLVALAGVTSGIAAQDAPRVATGRITAAANGAPIALAQVFLIGTNRSALSDVEGRYRLTGVPPGAVELRVVALGFSAQIVTADGPGDIVQSFVLERTVFSLDEMVVTATGQQRRRELGHVVGTIDAASVVESEVVRTTSDLLSARVSGVSVGAFGGGTGSGSRIRIRGSNSVSLRNDPIVYVDGVRVYSGTSIQMITGGSQITSRLNDFMPEDIESIEIVKGPSAATLYGTDAAAGVILITTRKGTVGPTKWSAHMEVGALSDQVTYPASYGGIDEDNGIPFLQENCRLMFVARGLCEQDRVQSFSVLGDPSQSPLDTGYRQQFGLSVSGGSALFRYRISGEVESEDGVWKMPVSVVDSLNDSGISVSQDEVRPNGLNKVSIRSNVHAQLSESTDLAISVGYLSNDMRRIYSDADDRGILWAGVLGSTSPEDRHGWGSTVPAQAMRSITYQDTRRWTGSATLNGRPLSFLTTRATAGLDFSSVNDHTTDVQFSPQGERRSLQSEQTMKTVDVGATAQFALTDAVSSRTSVGGQYVSDGLRFQSATGDALPPGCELVSCAATTNSNEIQRESVTLGLFIDQQFGLNDRVFLTAGVRADDNSAFGKEFDLAIYPKLQASWILSEEDFFPGWTFLDELRIRSAWGASGRQPGGLQSKRTYSGVTAAVPAGGGFTDVSAVTVGQLGNPQLKPERVEEFEVGFDASLFAGRLGLEVTGYRKRTRDALVREDLAPSLGVSASRFANVGEVRNDGIEALLQATLVRSHEWSVDLGISGSINENELLDLGDNFESIQGGFMTVGYPLGSAWDYPILSYADADGNGILTPDELIIGDTIEYRGPMSPTQLLTVNMGVTWRELIRVNALLDMRGGGVTVNGTEAIRCLFFLCEAMNDQSVGLEEQARAVAAVLHPLGSWDGYLESSDFARLREVSVTVFLPASLAGRFGASRASLSLSGRNLVTWTDFSGLDPESTDQGFQNFGSGNFMSQAPPRIISLRMSLDF